MSFTYGFYNSVSNDRTYTAIQMSQLFDGIISNGIFEKFEDAFLVTPGSGLEVLIGKGKAWFNNTWSLNDTIMPIEIDEPDILLDRIDTVVLEVNRNASVRQNSIKVIKGSPNSVPIRPMLQNDSFVNQYPLCDVLVKKDTTSFIATDLTNRTGSADCPFISIENQASGADVDLGTNNSKIVTPKSIFESSKLAYILPGENGRILSSNGVNWIAKEPDGWNLSLNTWTPTANSLSRAFTNDPAAGTNVVLNMANTSGFSKGELVLVKSGAGTELTVITAIVANTSITVLYLALNHTLVNPLVVLIKPNVVVSVDGDLTTKISIGTRIKLTQDGITKYFIVNAVSSYSGGVTNITLYTGPDINNDYNNYLTSSAISQVYFSKEKSPFGFPMNKIRWGYSFVVKGTTINQASPTLGTWYNLGNICFLLPVGDFVCNFKINTGLVYGATAGGLTWVSLSTSASAESQPEFTWSMSNTSTSVRLNNTAFGSGEVNTITDTLMYLILKATLYCTVNLQVNSDTTFISILTFESTYL